MFTSTFFATLSSVCPTQCALARYEMTVFDAVCPALCTPVRLRQFAKSVGSVLPFHLSVKNVLSIFS